LTELVRQSKHGAVILTELPDLSPRAQTPQSIAFRRDFYRRWGRENCVVSGTSRRAEYGLFRQTLSIKCVARGNENYFIDRRRVTVSDDTFLILNEGRVYASSLITPTEAYSFSIFFRPGLAQEIAGGLRHSPGQALEQGAQDASAAMEFDESLQAHDSFISPVLRFIQRQIGAWVRDEQWLEEQCQFLLERLIRTQQQPGASFPADRASDQSGERAELKRRLRWAIDFMHSHLPEEISLTDIAAAAHLSRFHFLRQFQRMFGRTPVAHLRELRTRRALALVESTSLGSGEIAERVGMSRVALWRSLRAIKGAGPRALRRLDDREPRVSFLGRPS
jgi:AraC family transcriptional regulator